MEWAKAQTETYLNSEDNRQNQSNLARGNRRSLGNGDNRNDECHWSERDLVI